ncbi:FAD-binding oxidoreductase [Arsenicicoccus sp. oral taxon 190]|uniref:FAD-binding oxidoreductase n=1 Tax=Arsenicicoccus sp. oral taxon 190 TaxID=1658671 RepID=UPI000AF16CFE|nr:FAD-linked oxidase C-terminal domain-containing protein [Arsenicicoccus sp. oral taxon 190]
MTTIVADLLASLPVDRVMTDPDAMVAYARDQAEWGAWGAPSAVVRARSTDEVQATVRACLQHGTPIVARGAGTGLSGAANAEAGWVVLSLERMDQVLEVNTLDRLAVVQPGVINDQLRAAAAEHGLWYPPDPGSAPWSTIGGNVATNAGGMCCVKYGVTRDYVLALEVVTGTGEVVRVGRRTAKGVVGYDLVGLLTGSEGTLGIITEVTVRLRPAREPERTVAGFFPDLLSAGRAVTAVAEAGLTPSLLELMDRTLLQAVDDWKHMGLTTEADTMLLGRIDTPGECGDAEAEAMAEVFRAAGAVDAAVAEDEEEGELLFAARRLAYPAAERLGTILTEDVCVPKDQVVPMLERIQEIGRRHGTTIANAAHAGDGNLHPLLVTEPGNTEQLDRAHHAFGEIIAACLELGGTISGEHGVGTLKRDGLHAELGEPVVELHRAIKSALDPHGIMNPGKVFRP